MLCIQLQLLYAMLPMYVVFYYRIYIRELVIGVHTGHHNKEPPFYRMNNKNYCTGTSVYTWMVVSYYAYS